jgi:hypothetical protein
MVRLRNFEAVESQKSCISAMTLSVKDMVPSSGKGRHDERKNRQKERKRREGTIGRFSLP